MQNVLNSYVVPVSTPTELAGLATNRFSSGQPAVVAAIRPGAEIGNYTLQSLISSLPDNIFVVPAADDPNRQWVYSTIQDQSIANVVSAELDLTQVQSVPLLPPLNMKGVSIVALAWNITAKDGTVTTGPTANVGTDAPHTNMVPSGIQTGVAAGALNARVTMTGLVAISTLYNLDFSSSGVFLQITNGAILGTAMTFKAKVTVTFLLYK